MDIRHLALVRTAPVGRPARTALPPSVYRRRRTLAVLAVVSAAAALVVSLQVLLAVLAGPPFAATRPKAPAASVYVVQPGDTFWQIAQRLRPNEDPRPLVARMVAAHGSPVLVAGERVALPAAA